MSNAQDVNTVPLDAVKHAINAAPLSVQQLPHIAAEVVAFGRNRLATRMRFELGYGR